MDKPQKVTKTFYRYLDCSRYLEQKYGYEERDWKNKKDFWHWVVDHYCPARGSFMTFHRQALDEIQEDWVRKIFTHYLDEFAENDRLEMFVDW